MKYIEAKKNVKFTTKSLLAGLLLIGLLTFIVFGLSYSYPKYLSILLGLFFGFVSVFLLLKSIQGYGLRFCGFVMLLVEPGKARKSERRYLWFMTFLLFVASLVPFFKI